MFVARDLVMMMSEEDGSGCRRLGVTIVDTDAGLVVVRGGRAGYDAHNDE